VFFMSFMVSSFPYLELLAFPGYPGYRPGLGMQHRAGHRLLCFRYFSLRVSVPPCETVLSCKDLDKVMVSTFLAEGIPYPADLLPGSSRDGQHIESARAVPPLGLALKKITGGIRDPPLFCQGDAFGGASKVIVSAKTNLDEYQVAALPHHQVDLSSSAVKVALYQFQPPFAQVALCQAFGRFTSFPGITHSVGGGVSFHIPQWASGRVAGITGNSSPAVSGNS